VIYWTTTAGVSSEALVTGQVSGTPLAVGLVADMGADSGDRLTTALVAVASAAEALVAVASVISAAAASAAAVLTTEGSVGVLAEVGRQPSRASVLAPL